MSDTFAGLGLAPELVRAVSDEGYTTPTPVQAQAIPLILAGRDVLAGAQTGTGKTAGFTLPMLQRLAAARIKPAPRCTRALVLTPTRELAAQVEASVRTYGRHSGLRSVTVYGGVGMTPQVQALARGVDILVATPGRLLDHVQGRTCDLSKVEIVVLDEADRMLDMGFIRDIRRILALLPKQRQSLLFSATFSKEIRELAGSLLDSPAQVQIARERTDAELITQRIIPVDKDGKRATLVKLIREGNWQQVLVFSRTKHGANRLAEQIERDGISATAIHGNKSQPQRTRALADFKAGKVRVLVATDIAARGLDIVELPHVVNYDLPNVPEDYVHRIGRTGRAGCTGEAVSLVSPEDRPLLADIERLLGRRLSAGVEAVPMPHAQRQAPRPAHARPQAPKRGQQQPKARPQQPQARTQPQPKARPQPQPQARPQPQAQARPQPAVPALLRGTR